MLHDIGLKNILFCFDKIQEELTEYVGTCVYEAEKHGQEEIGGQEIQVKLFYKLQFHFKSSHQLQHHFLDLPSIIFAIYTGNIFFVHAFILT